MRDLIDIITENGLTAGELAKHDGKYLKMLTNFATKGPVALTPDVAQKLGEPEVTLAPETIKALQQSVAAGNPLPSAPMFVLSDGSQVKGSWGAINKGGEYTNRAEPTTTDAEPKETKSYNAGHLAELFMGLAITAKFFNFGKPIKVDQMIELFAFSQVSSHTSPTTGKLTTNVLFTISQNIDYPAQIKGLPDHLTFRGVIPGNSAREFMKQVKTRQFPDDIRSVMASSARYVNEAPTVESSIKLTQQDKNTNQINITSDGSSDAKMTKADIVLSVDGKKVNLFSLKTYSSDTLGQISGVTFEQVSQWFMTSFGINLSKYKQQIEAAKTPAEAFEILLGLYDIYFPQIQKLVDNQSPNSESAIVSQLAKAANLHARGANGEDVEIVKLDDKIKEGNYKILKFSDDLVDAMSKLDLAATMKVKPGAKNRTIQIWAKPDATNGLAKANKLCQFRTQKMGKAYRNYFETGPMLEKLTQVGGSKVTETELPIAHNHEPEYLGTEKALGRKRQK